MVISDCYDLQNIIVELEIALQIDAIDYDEKNLDNLIKNVKTRISRQYQLNLTEHKIGSADLDLGVYKSAATIFVDNLASIHSKICGLCQLIRYEMRVPISLAEINYMGFTKDTLKVSLIALQKKKTQPKAGEVLNAIKDKLPTVSLCWEKRLFVLAIVAYELGLNELTATIAEVLYLGLIE